MYSTICLIWILQLSLQAFCDALANCSQSDSRIVQRFIESELELHYAAIGIKIPKECPLHLDKTAFYLHESMKMREHASRHICLMCGKAFYEEHFLDRHLTVRHSEVEQLKWNVDGIQQGPDIVCLADYCDIIRCDVISGTHKPEYWDKALCKDSDLEHRQEKCQMIIGKCVPDFVETSERRNLQDVLKGKICSYLNCNNYWEIPNNQVNPLSAAVYIMAFMILCVGLTIYYYVAYTHFFTDESLWDQWRQEEVQQQHRHRYQTVPQGQEIRQRTFINNR